MNRLKQLKTYPFGLFLCVEWILLVSALFVDLPVSFLFTKYYNYNINASIWVGSTLSLISLIALGVMGLKFPQKELFKWLYLCLQIGLIWLPTIYNHKIDLSLFLYLVVAIRNGLIFQSRCKLANILLFLSFVPSLIFIENYQEFRATVLSYQNITSKDYQWMSSIEIALSLILFALCIILFWMLVDVSLREYQSQQQLAYARQQLRQYAIQAEERATVHERNRIAREIHDSVGHALTAQTIQLNNAIAFWQVDRSKAYQFIIEAKQLTATALKEIRSSVSSLRSDPLEGKSLPKAIALLFQEFSSRTQIVPQSNIVLDRYITEEIKLTIYRIVQEALTNIAKHSKARDVKVNLQTFSEHLHLSIEDDGKGFDPKLNTTGFGLQGMQERITSLNGKLEIDSIDSGCKIAIDIPYQTLLINN